MQEQNGYAFTNQELLHKRQGHIADININCISCFKGKQASGKFKNSVSKTTKILELIHSDVCGPMEVNSIGGGLYFLTFLNDYSNKLFTYILKRKSVIPETFEKFKKWLKIKQMNG